MPFRTVPKNSEPFFKQFKSPRAISDRLKLLQTVSNQRCNQLADVATVGAAYAAEPRAASDRTLIEWADVHYGQPWSRPAAYGVWCVPTAVPPAGAPLHTTAAARRSGGNHCGVTNRFATAHRAIAALQTPSDAPAPTQTTVAQ